MRQRAAGRCHFYIWQAGYWRVPCRETLQAFSTLSICCLLRLSMADEPGTSHATTPPPATATGATPMAMPEAAVRGLIREEVAVAIAAAFKTPAPRALPPPGYRMPPYIILIHLRLWHWGSLINRAGAGGTLGARA